MVGHYLILYRSVTTGIPVFLVNTPNKCGRGKADIMDNLKDWTGTLFLHIITIITAFLRLHSCKVQEISLSLYFKVYLLNN